MFSALFITFREGLEAALIIAIIVAYLVYIKRPELKKYVWIGVASAIGLSLVIGIAILIIYGSLSGISEKIFEGSASILATAVLTGMVFWMAKNAKNIKENLHRKIDETITRKQTAGIAVLVFIAVFREGIETVLFLSALYGADALGTITGFAAGMVIVTALSVMLMKGTLHLPVSDFFKYTGIILIIFAAGLFGYGIHEFIEVGEDMGYDLGILAYKPFDINPPDPTNPFHEKGAIGSILKTLVGYDGNPELLRIIGYIGYWIVVGGIFFKKMKKENKPLKNKIKRPDAKTLKVK